MTADYETVHVVGVALERLAQEIFQTCAIQRTTHTDHAVTRQTECVQGEVSHRVHRVGNNHEDCVRAVFQHLIANALDDTGVYTDKLLTRHTRFARQTRSDDHYVRSAGLRVVVGHTFHYRVEAHQLGGLHNIHGFALSKTLFDVNQTYLVGYLVYGQHVCASSTYVSCAYNSYFTHSI